MTPLFLQHTFYGSESNGALSDDPQSTIMTAAVDRRPDSLRQQSARSLAATTGRFAVLPLTVHLQCSTFQKTDTQ